MAEAPNSGSRLPDEAFVSHARRPNPSVDEHVAFPDEATRPGARADALPQSAWAGSSRRPKEPVPPELAHIPPEVATLIPGIAARQRQRRVSRSRFNPAGLGLAVIVALALLLGTNASVQLGPSGPVVERGWDERSGWSESWDELDLVATPAVVDTILPVDQPRYEIPLGPSRLRIEIVSDDPSADVVVTSDSGEAQLDDVAEPVRRPVDPVPGLCGRPARVHRHGGRARRVPGRAQPLKPSRPNAALVAERCAHC